MSDQNNRERHHLYLDKSKPEEFINIELMDWVYLVGDISTQYELDFVRQFGHALKTRDAQMREELLDALTKEIKKTSYTGECKSGWNPVDGANCDDSSTCPICVISWAIESLRSEVSKE